MASDVKMELNMLNLEQVVVGESVVAPVKETKPVIIQQPYQHDSLQCFQCFITFCNSKAKERHMRKSHREEYKQQLQQTDTLFTCYVCDRTFPSSEELTQHQATHSTEDKPFRCPHCQGSFATFSELTDHRRNLCAERHCVCKDCGMLFRGPAKLRTHRLTRHPAPDAPPPDDGFTHRCPKCQQGFETETELLQHQELHAGDEYCNGKPPARKRGRPAKAQTDGEVEVQVGKAPVFKRENSEEAQTAKRRGRPPKQQQQPKQELNIPCPVGDCKVKCTSLVQLRVHKKEAHPPPPPPRKAHACAECEESYGRAEQLQAHMRRAHGSDRHTCPTCGKSFGRESNLKAHQKSHSEGEGAEEDKG
ncbi:zinc finger protein CKR1-like [Sardina pilchardus]|uniref:zinc finger protein CKR1-like n=1 Tax=Sardina pilchardus TaxID=27697 RepID=UPI002E152053